MANNAAASAKVTDLHPIHLLVPEFYTCGGRQALWRAYDDALVVLRGAGYGRLLCSTHTNRVPPLLNDAWHQSMWRCLPEGVANQI